MILQKTANFLGAIAISISSLTVVPFPANSQPTGQTLQALPDSIYFYSKERLPKQSGSEYIVLRKKGKSFIYYGYVYESDSSCGAGTIAGNTINNTRKYTPLESDNVVEHKFSLNLNQYYKLSSRYISAEDRKGLQSCINTMSR